MEVDDFVQYRRLFYFFQYAFAVRGNLAIDPFDTSNQLNVMQELVQDPEWFHFRNEFVPTEPISSSRRNKPNLQPDTPVAPSSCRLSLQQTKRLRRQCGTKSGDKVPKRREPVLYIATDESQYRHLMLNNGEWLKTKNGRIWKDFINLYRALIIFDLYQQGETEKSICQKYGAVFFEDKEFSDIQTGHTITFGFYCTQNLLDTLTPFLYTAFRHSDESISLLRDCCIGDVPFISKSDENEYAAALTRRVQSHFSRSLQLIRLAETGAFKTFPLVISPLQ